MGWLFVAGLPAGIPLSGAFPVGVAWAEESPAAFDSSYKQSGKLAAQLAQRYDAALRQTTLRLGEVARRDAEELARTPLAIETSRSPWPIAAYVMNGDRLSRYPQGKAQLTVDEVEAIASRKSRVLAKPSSVLVAVPGGPQQVTTAEIPLSAFTAPLESLSLGGDGALLLLDDQGRSLGRKSLSSEDQELLKSVSTEASTTLVSKTSVLSLARIPTAGWTIVVRLPLTEAYRGIAMPEIDERELPNPLYIVKLSQGGSLEGAGKGLLFTFGGLALLGGALYVLRRRLKAGGRTRLRDPFSDLPDALGGPLSSLQTGGRALLEALAGEKADLPVMEPRPEPRPLPPPPQMPVDGATTGVWRDTLQAQVTYLLGEFRQAHEQMQTFARQPQLDALQSRMEAEFDSFTEALRQRLDIEARRLETLRAQQAHQAELSEGKLGMLESELEGYRNQGLQADRQANERIEVLAKALQDLRSGLAQAQESNGKFRQEVHAALMQAQQENARLREELATLSARVHRVVQLLAKGRTA